MPAVDPSPLLGSCRGCGYALQGLTLHRCPECGRAFDPADPKTMHIGRTPGAIARWLSRPLRWNLGLAALLLATIAIAVTTRPQLGPWESWDLWPVDLEFYVRWVAVRPHLLLTSSDYAYAAGIWISMIVIGWTLLRSALGWAVRRRYRITIPPIKHLTRRFLLATALLLISGACVLVGWPYRLGQHVAASYMQDLASAEGNATLNSVKPYFPIIKNRLAEHREQMIVQAATIQSPEPRQRIAGLAMAQQTPIGVPALALEAIGREEDPTVLEWEIRVLGLTSDRGALDVVDRFLASPDPRLRMAALEAIVLSLDATSSRFDWLTLAPSVFASTPRIPILHRPGGGGLFAATTTPPEVIQYSQATHRRVGEILETAADQNEREAAARALFLIASGASGLSVNVIDDFRVAEWGVWVQRDGMVAANEVTDDIPPFVHHYTDPVNQLAGKIENRFYDIVDKPVIHFYTNQPLAVSVQATIRYGRIAYVYPQPDDYLIGSRWWAAFGSGASLPPTTQPLAKFDARTNSRPFVARRDVLPSVTEDPVAAKSPSPFIITPTSPAPELNSIGFRWDRLAILPQRQAWMQPPAVGPDPKYAWWPRLREVPAAWVSNRGESERFLYYDGPTLTRPNVRVTLSDPQHLSIENATGEDVPDEKTDTYAVTGTDGMKQTARADRRGERRGMYIDVADKGMTAEVVPLPSGARSPKEPTYTIGTSARLELAAAERTLRDWLIDAGLTGAEADGLLACWRQTFFHKPGKRFVMLMSAVDYDSLCPIALRPRPKTLARVGLVWTELGASPANNRP